MKYGSAEEGILVDIKRATPGTPPPAEGDKGADEG